MLRFAQSTKKDMNIGNLQVALFNHILSKQLNEELLIRIDDTDKKNHIEGQDKKTLELLNLFSIDYSKVVYQSENIKYHTQMAMKLLLDKKAFNCFCSEDALALDKEKAEQENKPYRYSGFCETISDEAKFNCNAPFVVRLKKPESNITFIDKLKGEYSYEPFDIGSFTILKHDKSPNSNYASAVDDMLYDTSMIIKGENQLRESAKQIHIRASLGYEKEIQHIHLPQIKYADDILSVDSLIEQGYLPVAIANYLISLGYETPKEIFTIEEAIEWFDITKISQESLLFDIERLNHINKEYLKTMDEMRLSKILGFADKDIGTLGKIYIQECNTTKEIKEKLNLIFNQKITLDGFENELKALKECLQNAPFIDDFNDLEKYITKKTQLSGDTLNATLQFALTGSKNSPDISTIYPLIKNYLGEIIR
ncbi:MAG: glutamate--tRNA ligase family protein [Arcobacteraceae bacterium]